MKLATYSFISPLHPLQVPRECYALLERGVSGVKFIEMPIKAFLFKRIY